MSYILDTNQAINMPTHAQNSVTEELLSNYTYGRKWKVSYNGEDNCITVGNYTKADRGGSEFVLNVTDEGVYIAGYDYPSTMRGFLTLLEKIKYSPEENFFFVENNCIIESPSLPFRGVHLCIFPETKLDFLKKCVRSCAIAKFSHIIFEFWGMLKFDCMKELSWPFAYSKQEIKAIVKEANALGVEIIPMFNHLGHASSCRAIHGKHVVLDQNPRYEYMFDSYGWIWNFKREDVCELLRKVRNELIDVCGKGSYFHIGCDEAYSIGNDEGEALKMTEYINGVADELKSMGRRVIMWHDMLLSRDSFKGYYANSGEKVSAAIMKNIDKSIIMADWQYSCHDEIWKTSKALSENGFDVVCCPWDGRQNILEAVNTVKSCNLRGIIHTTWHTMFRGFGEMIYAGIHSYGTSMENLEATVRFYCASVTRKALPSCGDYEKSGWSEKTVGPGL